MLVSSDEWGRRGEPVRLLLPSDCRVCSSASMEAASGAMDGGSASDGSGGMDERDTNGTGGGTKLLADEVKGGEDGKEREVGIGERATVAMEGERE